MSRKTLETSVSDFIQSIGLLVRRARAAAASNELSWSEIAVLKHLAKQGAATTAELARTHGMRPQSMRTVIATLVDSGRVERRPHPTDGRQVTLRLTARGSADQESSGEAKRTWLAQNIARLDCTEQETLFRAGEIIRRLMESDS